MKTLLKALVLGSAVILSSVPALAAKAPVEQGATRLNINKASAQMIADHLKGIGLKKAQAIIRYREVRKGLKSVDELLAVKGVGEKTLARIRPLITL